MSLRDQPGTFPTGTLTNSGGHKYNVSDTVAAQGNWNSLRSTGATLITVPALTPDVSQKWRVRSLAMSASLVWFAAQTGGGFPVPSFGALGKIQMGIIPGQTNPSPAGQISPSQQFWQPPPVDNSLVTDLWNPATDRMPPQSVAGILPFSGVAPIGTSLSLPQDRDVINAQAVGIGIWINPSIIGTPVAGLGSTGLAIFDAAFVITYDDGLG